MRESEQGSGDSCRPRVDLANLRRKVEVGHSCSRTPVGDVPARTLGGLSAKVPPQRLHELQTSAPLRVIITQVHFGLGSPFLVQIFLVLLRDTRER